MYNETENKKVIYRSFVTNSYNNLTSGSSFNALVNSGIVHFTAVLLCPFIAATTGTNSGFGDFQWKSPFDTCPSTLSGLSLINYAKCTSCSWWPKRAQLYSKHDL
jgi:hypothetical protein